MMTRAYHGYLIRSNYTGDIWIEKNRQLIAWATSIADAEAKIDALLKED